MDSSEIGFEFIKHGNIRIEIHFGNTTARTLTEIVFAEHDNLLESDQDRNVAFDDTASTRYVCSRTTLKPKKSVLWINWKNLFFPLLTPSISILAENPENIGLLFILTKADEENISTVTE